MMEGFSMNPAEAEVSNSILQSLLDYSPVGAGIAIFGYFLGKSIVQVFKMILDRTEKERATIYARQEEMQKIHDFQVNQLGQTCHIQQDVNAKSVDRIANAVEKSTEATNKVILQVSNLMTKIDTLVGQNK